MTELARLHLTEGEHSMDLILTDTSLILDADSELHQYVAGKLSEAAASVEHAPKFVAWFAKRMIGFGARKVEELFGEHPLGRTEFALGTSELHVTIDGHTMDLGHLHYNRDEANQFVVSFRAQKRKLGLG